MVLDLDYDLEEGLTNIDLSRYPLLRKDLLKSKGREKLNIEYVENFTELFFYCNH